MQNSDRRARTSKPNSLLVVSLTALRAKRSEVVVAVWGIAATFVTCRRAALLRPSAGTAAARGRATWRAPRLRREEAWSCMLPCATVCPSVGSVW